MWEIEGETSVGTTPAMSADGSTWTPNNFQIFCGQCGTVWAKRTILIERNPLQANEHWWAKKVHCRDCTSGSLWTWHDECWNLSLTHEALVREILICADLIDRGMFPRRD